VAASDEQFLRLAIDLARQARQRGVEPFAAVLVLDDVVVHQALEGRIETSDPTFHAELRVMSEYCRLTKRLSTERLYALCKHRTLSDVFGRHPLGAPFTL